MRRLIWDYCSLKRVSDDIYLYRSERLGSGIKASSCVKSSPANKGGHFSQRGDLQVAQITEHLVSTLEFRCYSSSSGKPIKHTHLKFRKVTLVSFKRKGWLACSRSIWEQLLLVTKSVLRNSMGPNSGT